MEAVSSVVDMVGRRVLTHAQLESTLGMLVAERHLHGRKPNALGIITGYVPGHGGDCWWVRHAEGPSSANPSPVAAYTYTEFEFTDGDESA